MISLHAFRHLNLALTLFTWCWVPVVAVVRRGVYLPACCMGFAALIQFLFIAGLPPQMPLGQRMMHGLIQCAVDLLPGFACAAGIVLYMRRKARAT